ncbi:hypothetical protein MMPV_003104 [Pyropia vietnamensis]
MGASPRRTSEAYPTMRRVALLIVAAVATALLVAVTPAVAQTGAAFKKAKPNTDLRVTASAQVKAPFNEAVVNINLNVERPTLQETIASSRFAVASVRRLASAESIPASAISTRNIALRPRFNQTRRPREFIGWSLVRVLHVTTGRVGRVQSLLQKVATTVGRTIEVNLDSSLRVGSVSPLILRALREATLAARDKANRIAKSTGKQVKRVVYLGGNKGSWPRQYAANGLYTVACRVDGKFLLVTPGQVVSDDDAEERLEDIVRVDKGEAQADDFEAALAEVAARPDAHMEVSGTTKGEAVELYGNNPADQEFDTVVELHSMEEALEGVF